LGDGVSRVAESLPKRFSPARYPFSQQLPFRFSTGLVFHPG
jgi:hypothetical protein